MPYIISTTEQSECWDRHTGATITQTTRRAVATLDEARDEVSRIVAASHPNIPHGLGAIAEPGTIGPLPDGTVIEVERVTMRTLLDAIGVKFAATAEGSTSVIDAYNAAQVGS